jgi:hypothetical protein
MRAAAAAILYFMIVYAAGFMFGTVRVFLLEPRVGDTLATLCEAPVLLAVIVLAARSLPARLNLPRATGPLLGMGIGALVLQQLADFAFGVLLRGATPAQQLMHFATPAGAIYLVLLLAFVAMPLLANRPPARHS